MEKIKLVDDKQYLIKLDMPNKIKDKTWTVGRYFEEYECFNLNPTIDFKQVSECIDIDEIKKLQHHKDTTVGLWATDRPDLVSDPKGIMFQLD